jgi:hypothetical protein
VMRHAFMPREIPSLEVNESRLFFGKVLVRMPGNRSIVPKIQRR